MRLIATVRGNNDNNQVNMLFQRHRTAATTVALPQHASEIAIIVSHGSPSSGSIASTAVDHLHVSVP